MCVCVRVCMRACVCWWKVVLVKVVLVKVVLVEGGAGEGGAGGRWCW